MNTHNHHRIIEETANSILAADGKISKDEIKWLKKASDFTDDFGGSACRIFQGDQRLFFYYHFYYDITCKDGVIVLERSNYDEFKYGDSKKKCSIDNPDFDDSKIPFAPKVGTKKFFITINDREEVNDNYLKAVEESHSHIYNVCDKVLLKISERLNSSNQSDCVSFLHAMGAKGEHNAINVFKEHVVNCLAEYLFLGKDKEAYIMLGIAIHSLMDSFTPSHTGFQNYSEQDLALHAQGDVIPFRYEEFSKKQRSGLLRGECVNQERDNSMVDFSPGQYDKSTLMEKVAARAKRYNGSEFLNAVERDMLKLYADCYLDGEASQNQSLAVIPSNVIVNIMLHANKRKFKEDSYKYSEYAIDIVKDVFMKLKEERKQCSTDYDKYKAYKRELKAYLENLWLDKYNIIQFSNNGRGNYATNPELYKKRKLGPLVYIEVVLDFSYEACDKIKAVLDFISVVNGVAPCGSYIAGLFKDILVDQIRHNAGKIGDLLAYLETEGEQALIEAKDIVVDKCDQIIDNAQDIIHTSEDLLSEAYNRIDSIKENADELMNTAKTVCATLKDNATDIKDLAEYVKSNVDQYAQSISDTVSNVIGGANNMVDQAQQLFGQFSEGVVETAKDTLNQFSGLANGACESVKEAANFIDGITDKAQAAFGKYVPSSIFDKIRGCTKVITNVMDGAQAGVNNMNQMVADKLVEAREVVIEQTSIIADNAHQALNVVEEQTNTMISSAQEQAEKLLDSAQDFCDDVQEQVEIVEYNIDFLKSKSDEYLSIVALFKDKVTGFLDKADNFLASVDDSLSN